jgi:sterol desaturase/sphingolipid hydroxylase (fatty acid hydroxylase superfamily)
LHFLSAQFEKLLQAGAILLSPGAILSLPELVISLILAAAFLTLRQHRRRGRIHPRAILRALLASRRILLHPSTGADLIYYAINTFAIATLIGWGILSAGAVSAFTTLAFNHHFGARAPATLPAWELRAGITLVTFLAYEFGYYLDHVMKHRIPFFWEFHKTHHSAEVLTPLTVYRVHPFDTLIFVNIIALSSGLCHGAFTYAAGKPINLYAVDGTNTLLAVCFFLLAQLQHSQFWIPLRGLPGRILLSPAHHQLHHSLDPAHYNQNFGSFLAVFDWLFRTLTIPPLASPRLKFGVHQAVREPHRLTSLLLTPIAGALATLRPQPPLPEPLTHEPNPAL